MRRLLVALALVSAGCFDFDALRGTFRPLRSNASAGLDSVSGSDPDHVFIVGKQGTILRTTDRGKSFTVLKSGTTIDLTGVWAASPTDVLAVGIGGLVLRTTDGGESWTQESSPVVADLKWIHGTGLDNMYAVGESGTVMRSVDGGVTWTLLPTIATGKLKSVWADGPHVYVVGALGMILHSSNRGGAWAREAESVVQRELQGVYGVASGGEWDLYASGEGGILLTRQRDGRWSAVSSGVTQDLDGIWASFSDIYSVGDEGVIVHSTDQGRTFKRESSGSGIELNGVWGSSSQDLFIVGELGRVLHRP